MELKIKVDFAHGEENELVRLIAAGIEKGLDILNAMHKDLHFLIAQNQKFMATTQENLDKISGLLDTANDKLDTQAAAITAAKGSLDGVVKDVADLKDQISKLGSGANAAQIDELASKAQSLSDKLDTATAGLADLAGEAKDLDDSTTQTPPAGGGDTGGGTTTPPDGGGTTAPPDGGTVTPAPGDGTPVTPGQ